MGAVETVACVVPRELTGTPTCCITEPMLIKTGKLFGQRIVAALLAATAMAAAAGVAAQTVADDVPTPNAPLNLPKDVTLLGPVDPHIHKATAIVNGTIITDTDVEQRLALTLFANGGKVEGEERVRLKQQILRNIVDETLQIQEAKANEIEIEPAEINQTYARVAGNFKHTAATFGDYLRTIGSSDASIRRQIEGELAWRRLLARQIEPFVNVGEEEVQGVIARLNASKGQQEYHVSEIFLSATPETQAQVLQNANRIIEQIKGGGSFVAYARQYSESTTAAVGGDLDWMRAEQMPDELAQVMRTMPTGSLSQPIANSGGYSILAMIDTRQVLTTDPRDAMLALKQIAITFPKGATEATAAPRVAAFGAAIKTITGCGTADAVAATITGAEVVENDQVRVRDLPGPLQDVMLKLQIGQVSPAFGSIDEGVRTLVLCGRDEPRAAAGPDSAQIQARMEEERVNKRALRYMRDLRRDAVVDYR